MKKDDIAENVLKRGKEGVKQNIIEALDEFFDEYADEMWMVVEEVIKLRAENAALHERLEKAVELREPRITVDHWGGLCEVVYEKVQVVSEGYETRSEAETRVAQLKGEKE